MRTLITDKVNYPVQPQDIDTANHFWNAFGNMEKEVSARWIIRLCQRNGSWRPFTPEEFESFYNKPGKSGFRFNGLDTEEFVVLDEDDGRYRVTHTFIASCFKSSPAGA